MGKALTSDVLEPFWEVDASEIPAEIKYVSPNPLQLTVFLESNFCHTPAALKSAFLKFLDALRNGYLFDSTA